MKCAKVLILKVFSDHRDSLIISDSPAQVKEVRKAGQDLGLKYILKNPNQMVLSMDLCVSTGSTRQDKDFGKYRVPVEIVEAIQNFAEDSDDLGIYIIAHCMDGQFAGGLSGSQLGLLINTLGIKIKKINVVACNAARKTSGGQSNIALLQFCRELTLNPQPIVAGYPYPVFVADGGLKRYIPRDGSSASPIPIKDALNAGKEVKVAYKCDKGKWTKVDLDQYRLA